jgi:hypothetical protein
MRRAGILIAVTCVCAMAAIGLNARLDDRRQAMQAPQPGPEMQRLNFLIGSWDTVSEYEKSPMMPNGAKQNGWYKAQLGPGGFSVIADLEEDSPMGKDLGHEIISWDPKKKAYTVVVLGNGFPGAVIGSAKWQGDDLVISNDVGEGASSAHLRAVYVHPQGNMLHIEESVSLLNGPYKLMYTATASKK